MKRLVLITAITIPLDASALTADDKTFEVSDLAVAELHKHGWEPPAGASYDVTTYDPDTCEPQHLVIPARTTQATAGITVEQLEELILTRIHARLDGPILDSRIRAAIGDAAEAILDRTGADQ